MFSVATPALNGWHKGERYVQDAMHFTPYVEDAYSHIISSLPPQHRMFHSNNIAFLPVASQDDEGRVWASLLAGEQGKPGFIFSPDDKTLIVLGDTWVGEPTRENWKNVQGNETLIAGVGVELESRRRNKFAGTVKRAVWSAQKDKVGIEIGITQAIGNCPKYITVRHLESYSNSSPSLHSSSLHMGPSETLPADIAAHILSADTIFFATVFTPDPSEISNFPPHLGCNHRGGPKGFLRISPSKKNTIYLPDYSGNRLMTSLGNVESNPSVGVVIPDFHTGNVLYLTGKAKNLIGEDAEKVMKRVKLLTEIEVTGYTLVHDALPFRHSASYAEEKSPYTPPVRYLVEEATDVDATSGTARVIKTDRLTDNLMRITFAVDGAEGLKWKAGQYVVLDTTSIIGETTYAHMSSTGNEKSVNEDGIRTWTISSSPPSSVSTASKPTFSITIRHLPAGRATSRLFALLAQNPAASLTSQLTSPINLSLLGTGGSFLLPLSPETPILAAAGGIGITPFLAFLGELKSRGGKMTLLVSTRESEVMWQLIKEALSAPTESEATKDFILDLHLFDSTLSADADEASTSSTIAPKVVVRKTVHASRMNKDFFKTLGSVETGTKAYVCGPKPFEEGAIEGFEVLGVKKEEVERENFDY